MANMNVTRTPRTCRGVEIVPDTLEVGLSLPMSTILNFLNSSMGSGMLSTKKIKLICFEWSVRLGYGRSATSEPRVQSKSSKGQNTLSDHEANDDIKKQ